MSPLLVASVAVILANVPLLGGLHQKVGKHADNAKIPALRSQLTRACVLATLATCASACRVPVVDMSASVALLVT